MKDHGRNYNIAIGCVACMCVTTHVHNRTSLFFYFPFYCTFSLFYSVFSHHRMMSFSYSELVSQGKMRICIFLCFLELPYGRFGSLYFEEI
jgi:hypothetical protein